MKNMGFNDVTGDYRAVLRNNDTEINVSMTWDTIDDHEQGDFFQHLSGNTHCLCFAGKYMKTIRFQSFNTNKISWTVHKIHFHEGIRVSAKISEMNKTKIPSTSKQISPMMDTMLFRQCWLYAAHASTQRKSNEYPLL